MALIAVFFVMVNAQQLPPNKGDLTVAEFAQNYNYYNKLLNLGNSYLDKNGEWAEKAPSAGSYTIELGYIEKPEFSFTTENGYVTGLSFVVEIENNDRWLIPYDKYIVPASLAFSGAQRGMGLFSKAPMRIAKRIKDNIFQGFRFTDAGIAFACDVEYSGYIDTMTFLMIPEENATETYFSLNFSMNILK